MRVSRLVVENLRSFRDRTEVTFDSGLNLLVGPNGGGKDHYSMPASIS